MKIKAKIVSTLNSDKPISGVVNIFELREVPSVNSVILFSNFYYIVEKRLFNTYDDVEHGRPAIEILLKPSNYDKYNGNQEYPYAELYMKVFFQSPKLPEWQAEGLLKLQIENESKIFYKLLSFPTNSENDFIKVSDDGESRYASFDEVIYDLNDNTIVIKIGNSCSTQAEIYNW